MIANVAFFTMSLRKVQGPGFEPTTFPEVALTC